MQLQIPPAIQRIYEQLPLHGYEAFFVGGCVRDAYMDTIVNDYDVTTNATTQEMIEVYKDSRFKVILTGIKHGTICVIHEHQRVEITTYRSDGEYENHRFPSKVTFTHSLSEDLLRRDFTMNAMACDLNGQFIDELGGCKDIDNAIIRCVGDANQRFNEDALRILRCLRFAHRFQFTIEEKTKQACLKHKNLLKSISIERVRDEFFLMLLDHQPHVMEFLDEYEIVPLFFSEINQKVTLEHLPSLPLKLACLFSSVDIAQTVLKRLHCANQLIHHVCLLISHQSTNITANRIALRHLLHQCGNDFQIVREIIAMKQGDQEVILTLLSQMEKSDDCYDLKKLAINGHDLIATGFHGSIIKTILSDCLDFILNDPKLNNKAMLIDYVIQKYR